MKISIIVLLSSLLSLVSCKKENNTPAIIIEPQPPTGTTLAMGSFVSSAHTTSGTAKIVKDAANKIYLVFENFRTDNGPDLRTWVSPNNNGNPYQELGVLKAVSGNFSYALDASFDYTSNNRVLIWCKPFSVLYGYAVLQ